MASAKSTKPVKPIAPTIEELDDLLDTLRIAEKPGADSKTQMLAILKSVHAIIKGMRATAKPKVEAGTKPKNPVPKTAAGWIKAAISNLNAAGNNVELQKLLDSYKVTKDNKDVELKVTPDKNKTEIATGVQNALTMLDGMWDKPKDARFYQNLGIVMWQSDKHSADFKKKAEEIYKKIESAAPETESKTKTKKSKVAESDSEDEAKGKSKTDKKKSKKEPSDDEEEEDEEEEEEEEEEAPKAKTKSKAKGKSKKVASDDEESS
jgi:hypothetical protein